MIFRKRADTVPLPIPRPQVLTPSGTFEGNDGKWSTFTINIAGDGEGQGQNFNVLISTSSPMALVPAQNGWCTSDACAKSRGIMGAINGQQALGFDDQTTAWSSAGLYTLPLGKAYWFSDSLLLPNRNNSLNGEWGTTTVGLGPASKQSNTIGDQYIAIHYTEDLFLGSLGLSVGEVGFGSAQKPTFLSALASRTDIVPSHSYGFTAGASYRKFVLVQRTQQDEPISDIRQAMAVKVCRATWYLEDTTSHDSSRSQTPPSPCPISKTTRSLLESSPSLTSQIRTCNQGPCR
jgi:hypothetical protein